MSTPFSSALAQLDSSLDTVHTQINCLEAALEVNDDRLIHSLTDARRHAAKLRDLLRAHRPDAQWDSRRALGQLIQELELEIAAKAKRTQQRREKLLGLADELDAGSVKHRFDTRSAALNTLRLEAVKELKTEANVADDPKDLPGPDADAWLGWACTLLEPKDVDVLTDLRKNFPRLESFACEMEESYWVPPGHTKKPAPPKADPEPTSSVAKAPSGPVMQKQSQGEPSNDEALLEVIAAAPHVKSCENCGGTFPAQFQVCPFDGSSLASLAQASPVPATTKRADHAKTKQPSPVPSITAAPKPAPVPTAAAEPSTAPSAGNSARQATPQPPPEPAETEIERLKAILQTNPSDDSEFQLLDTGIPRKRIVQTLGIGAAVVLLSSLGISLYHSKGVSVSKLRTTVLAAGANVAGTATVTVPDPDIQRDLERKLALLKESSIQANVDNGVVTLVGRTASEWESLHAESLASQTAGVKGVKNEVQIQTDAEANNGKKSKTKGSKK